MTKALYNAKYEEKKFVLKCNTSPCCACPQQRDHTRHMRIVTKISTTYYDFQMDIA